MIYDFVCCWNFVEDCGFPETLQIYPYFRKRTKILNRNNNNIKLFTQITYIQIKLKTQVLKVGENITRIEAEVN